MQHAFSAIAHHALLRELVFDATDLDDADLKLFENLWLACSQIKVLRFRRCPQITGAFYLGDFLAAVHQRLDLDLLDLSKNQLTASATASLADSLFTLTPAKVKTLDLRYNRLSAEDNAILHAVFQGSRLSSSLQIRLEPFIPGLVCPLPLPRQAPQLDAEVDDLLVDFRRKRADDNHHIFDSYHDDSPLIGQENLKSEANKSKIEKNSPLSDASLNGGQLTFEADALEAEAIQLSSLVEAPNRPSLTELLVSTTKFAGHPDTAKKLLPAAVLDRALDICLEDGRAALEADCLADWTLASLAAGHLGLGTELLLPPDIRRLALAAKAKLYQLKQDLDGFLRFDYRPREANDLLDSLCDRLVRYGTVGEGADLVLLIKERRDTEIRRLRASDADEYDLQLEALQATPFVFLSFNRPLAEATHDVVSLPGSYQFMDVHENWIDYERLGSLGRQALIEVLEDRLSDEQLQEDGSAATNQLRRKRAAFMLCQPESSIFSRFRVDSLLVQSRLLCRLRWRQGQRATENLIAIEKFKDCYLETVLSSNLQAQENLRFIEESGRSKRSIIAEEIEILNTRGDELDALVDWLVTDLPVAIADRSGQAREVKAALRSFALVEVNRKQSATHPFFVTSSEYRFYLTAVIAAPHASKAALGWKSSAFIALLLSEVDDYAVYRASLLRFVLLTLLDQKNVQLDSDPNLQHAFDPDYRHNQCEVMLELARVLAIALAEDTVRTFARARSCKPS